MEKSKIKNGFTLLEVAVALGLMVMVFGSIASLTILTREAEQTSKNNLIAAYLAKEAQDLVRYQRDRNYLLGSGAFDSLISDQTEGSNYSFMIDYLGSIQTAMSNDVTLSGKFYLKDGFYGYDTSGTETNFQRLVTTTYHQSNGVLPAYIDVRVEVYWKADAKKNTYTLMSQLTDWR